MKVSCIIPTADRPHLLPVAIKSFLSQTWPDKELVVVDDGEPSVRDLVEQVPGAVYIRLAKRITVGEKRNLCCEAASGEIIAHFDDDDWSTPDRIADQVGLLTRFDKAVAGYSAVFVWDAVKRQAFDFPHRPFEPLGTSQCYRREWWVKHPFFDLKKREDGVFANIARDNYQLIVCVRNPAKIVVRVHQNQTCDYENHQQFCPVRSDLLPNAFFEAIGAPKDQEPKEREKCKGS